MRPFMPPAGYETLDITADFDYAAIHAGDLIVVCDHDDPTDIRAFEVHGIRCNRCGSWLLTDSTHQTNALLTHNSGMPCDDLLAACRPTTNKPMQEQETQP